MNFLKILLSISLICSGFLFCTPATAQNTGGVFGPAVIEGHRSVQYRGAFDPGTDALAQRIHYQASLDDHKMWRVIAQGRKIDNSNLDFDFVQAELFWELTPDNAKWRKGIRLDARIRDDGRPGSVGLNGMAQTKLSESTEFRALFMTSVEVGDDARDGVFLQTRAHLAHRVAPDVNVGLQMFNNYGSTDDLPGFDEQSHAIGPFVSRSFGSGFSVFADALFGVSDAAPDTNFRLWLTKGF